ncbi:hypothetical protein BHM03_00059531, partial [Ensete ventricosum]
IALTPLAPSTSSSPLCGQQCCASLAVALPTGDCPCGRRRCPRVAPRGQAGVMPAGGTSVGAAVAPLQAGRRGSACLAKGLAMVGYPLSSLRSLQKRSKNA